MKNLAMVLVLTFLTAGAVSAQTSTKKKVATENDKHIQQKNELKKDNQKRSPEQRADLQAQRLQTQFNLTDAQTSRIKEMSLAKAKQMDDLKAKSNENRAAMRAEMKALKSNWDEQMKSVLSPEQYAQFEKDRADKMARRQDNQGKHKGHKGKL